MFLAFILLFFQQPNGSCCSLVFTSICIGSHWSRWNMCSYCSLRFYVCILDKYGLFVCLLEKSTHRQLCMLFILLFILTSDLVNVDCNYVRSAAILSLGQRKEFLFYFSLVITDIHSFVCIVCKWLIIPVWLWFLFVCLFVGISF